MPHLNNKQNKIYKQNHQQRGLQPHSVFTTRERTNKQKKKKKNLSTNLTLYEAYTNHYTNLRKAGTKRKKLFNLEPWEKDISNTIN